ncbi:hypothetical protein GH141_00125 [bacterium]|nr:hypothetical protein [bacterium]
MIIGARRGVVNQNGRERLGFGNQWVALLLGALLILGYSSVGPQHISEAIQYRSLDRKVEM